MLEFVKYPPETPEEDRKGAPVCAATYPEACGRPAAGEVWALSFCAEHGAEAVLAARLEAHEHAGRALDSLEGLVEGERAVHNPLVHEALKGAKIPGEAPHSLAHDELVRNAYDLDEGLTDPDTLAYSYGEPYGDTPHDWWCEAREMVVGFMREAYVAGQSPLLDRLEPIREYATVQQELALKDQDRRYVEPRRAECEWMRKREAERAATRGPSAEILEAANVQLSAAIDALDTLPEGGPFDAEAVRCAKRAIAEAGGIVCKEGRRVFVDDARRLSREHEERPVG